MELNKVLLIGNLTRDPETRHTGSGMQVTNFTLAVNHTRSRENKETVFIRVDVWGKTAELVERFLQKGSEALVDGRLQMNEYETRDGQKRQEIRVVADRVQFGARTREGGGSSGGGSRDGGFTREPVRDYDDDYRSSDSRQSSGGGSNWSGGGNSEPSQETEDDLPF